MITDIFERQAIEEAKLARMHPEAYEAMIKARKEYDPIADLWNFLQRLFLRK